MFALARAVRCPRRWPHVSCLPLSFGLSSPCLPGTERLSRWSPSGDRCTPQHPSIRTKLVQALILLRNRGVLDPTELLTLFFGLFHCQVTNLAHASQYAGRTWCLESWDATVGGRGLSLLLLYSCDADEGCASQSFFP